MRSALIHRLHACHSHHARPFAPLLQRGFASAPQYSHIHVTNANSVLTIELDRPTVHNAFNEAVISDLTHAFTSAPNDSTRAVVLRSTGPSFSAGADLSWMKKMKDYTESENIADSDALFAMVHAIYQCPVPVIARVQGSALGGGVGLMAACDIAIATNKAMFGLTEVKLGLAPAVISPFVLNRLSITAASRYFLTGERFTAAQAQEFGLVTSVVESETELDATVSTIVKEILASSPQSVRKTKALLRKLQGKSRPIDSDMRQYVTRLIASLRVSAEGQEGVTSFLEKRPPSWRQ